MISKIIEVRITITCTAKYTISFQCGLHRATLSASFHDNCLPDKDIL